MKTPGLIVTILLMAFAFAPANTERFPRGVIPGRMYSAKLISPTIGQVLTLASKSEFSGLIAFPDMRNCTCVRWRSGCRWMAAERSRCALHRSSSEH